MGGVASRRTIVAERGRHRTTRVIIDSSSVTLLVTLLFVLTSAGVATGIGGATFSAATNSSRAGPTPAVLAGSADWPTYLQNPSRTSANLAPTTLSSSNIKTIDTLWTYKTKATVSGTTNTISASATVVNNVAYFGSWNGYEYAVNASTGKLIWSSFLGVAKTKGCGNQGIASSATVENGTLYVGGGDGNCVRAQCSHRECRMECSHRESGEWVLQLGESAHF